MKRIWLTRNLILLTMVSLAQDAASELLYPLLPILLTGVIGAAPLALGLIEGCAEAAAGFTKDEFNIHVVPEGKKLVVQGVQDRGEDKKEYYHKEL